MDEQISRIRPIRWVAHLPLAILPFLAAAAIEAPRLKLTLERAVAAQLAAAGQDWAKVSVRGRDLEIRGMAPDHAAADQARVAAAAGFGVRRVEMHVGVVTP